MDIYPAENEPWSLFFNAVKKMHKRNCGHNLNHGNPITVTQLLRKHWDMWDDHWDVETLRSARFTKRAQTQMLTFEIHM